MKKFLLPCSMFFVTCFLFLAPSVHADYSQAYSDYQFQYIQYRNAYQNYQIAKSTFLTYKTLATQNDALEKMRLVLTSRTNVTTTYLKLIQEKMAATEGLDKSTLDTFRGISQKEQAWLADNQKKISAASNINDLNTAAADFSSRYPEIKKEFELAIRQILYAKTDLAYSKSGDLFGRISQVLSQLENLGEDTTFYRRGLSSAQGKADLYLAKKEAATSLDLDLLNSQKFLQEGLEYLKESANFLKEILNSITGV